MLAKCIVKDCIMQLHWYIVLEIDSSTPMVCEEGVSGVGSGRNLLKGVAAAWACQGRVGYTVKKAFLF